MIDKDSVLRRLRACLYSALDKRHPDHAGAGWVAGRSSDVRLHHGVAPGQSPVQLPASS